jgi:hypothetical protein
MRRWEELKDVGIMAHRSRCMPSIAAVHVVRHHVNGIIEAQKSWSVTPEANRPILIHWPPHT